MDSLVLAAYCLIKSIGIMMRIEQFEDPPAPEFQQVSYQPMVMESIHTDTAAFSASLNTAIQANPYVKNP